MPISLSRIINNPLIRFTGKTKPYKSNQGGITILIYNPGHGFLQNITLNISILSTPNLQGLLKQKCLSPIYKSKHQSYKYISIQYSSRLRIYTSSCKTGSCTSLLKSVIRLELHLWSCSIHS